MAPADDAAVRAAMMAELGIERVEELHLEDKRKDHRGGHGSDVHNRRPPAPRARRAGQATFAQKWQDAMKKGEFDDADARAVSGLDDLGGGRIYDARSLADNATRITRTLLQGVKIGAPVNRGGCPSNQGHKQNVNPQPQSNRHVSPLGTPQQTGMPVRVFPPARVVTAASGAPALRAPTTVSGPPTARVPTTASGPPAPPAPSRPHPTVATSTAKAALLTSTEAKGVPSVPGVVLFQQKVRFYPGAQHIQLPAQVFLWTNQTSKSSLFTLFVTGNKYTEWDVSAYKDYLSAGTSVVVQFEMEDKSLMAYYLHFSGLETTETFLRLMRELNGKAPKQASEGKGTETSATPNPVIVDLTTPEPEKPEPVLVDLTRSPTTAQVPARGLGRVSPAPPTTEVLVESMLINLADDEVKEPQRQASPDSAMALLSSLEPFEYTPSPAPLNNQEDRFTSLAQHLQGIGRDLMDVFMSNKAAGLTESQRAETATGIKRGLTERLLETSCGLYSDMTAGQKKKAVDGCIGRLFETQTLRDTRLCETRLRETRRYSPDELLALRYAAVPSAAFLAELQGLPQATSRKKPKAISKPLGILIENDVYSTDHLNHSAGNMAWAMGPPVLAAGQGSTSTPRQTAGAHVIASSENGTCIVKPSVLASATQAKDAASGKSSVVGLQSSRWATAENAIENAQVFMGMGYDAKPGSYMKDLAGLDSPCLH